MLVVILTIIFLPIIAFLLIAASPVLLLLGVFAIILITFLWIGQFVAMDFALLFIIGFIVKMIEWKKQRLLCWAFDGNNLKNVWNFIVVENINEKQAYHLVPYDIFE